MKLWCYMDTHYCPASSEFSMSTEDFLKPDGSGLQIGQNSSPKSKGHICPHSSQHIHLSIGLSQILHIFINNYSISLSVSGPRQSPIICKARLGLAATSRNAEAIFPAFFTTRNVPMAKLRRLAITCGPFWVRTWERSSSNVTSRT